MTVLKNNLKRILKKKINLIFMIVVPIVLNLLFIGLATSNSDYNIGIIDYDQSALTKKFVETLGENCKIVELSEAEISDFIINSKVECVVQFDSGYANAIIKGENVTAKSYSLQESNVSEPINMFINSYLTAAKNIGKASGGDSDLFYKGMDYYYKQEYVAEYRNFESASLEDAKRGVQSLGYIAMGMMFLLTFSTSLILKDKVTRVYDRILTTPLSSKSYFIQNIISFFIIACIQVVGIMLILPNILDISYGDKSFDIIVVCLVFALMCIALGVMISRFSKNTTQANAYIGLVNLPMLMLGGCLWPRELMPDLVQKIGSFMPTHWFLQAAKNVLYGDGLESAIKEIGLLLGIAAVFFVLSFLIKTEREK